MSKHIGHLAQFLCLQLNTHWTLLGLCLLSHSLKHPYRYTRTHRFLLGQYVFPKVQKHPLKIPHTHVSKPLVPFLVSKECTPSIELSYKDIFLSIFWCFWTVVLEKTLESPLDCKEIQPFHPNRYQSWIFISRTDAEAETLILWPPDVKNWFIWKDPDAEKDWRQEEKGMTQNEMVGWHYQHNGHEFE